MKELLKKEEEERNLREELEYLTEKVDQGRHTIQGFKEEHE